MVDLAYSKKLYKRIIFVTVCITMSFLLSVTMFPTQAIAKAKENVVLGILDPFLQVQDSDSDSKDDNNSLKYQNNEESEESENISDNQGQSDSNGFVSSQNNSSINVSENSNDDDSDSSNKEASDNSQEDSNESDSEEDEAKNSFQQYREEKTYKIMFMQHKMVY